MANIKPASSQEKSVTFTRDLLPLQFLTPGKVYISAPTQQHNLQKAVSTDDIHEMH